jgi:hypothetical protein
MVPESWPSSFPGSVTIFKAIEKGCFQSGLTYSVLSPKPGSNQVPERYWSGATGGIKRVGLNREAAVQLRLWGLYHAQRGRGRHLAKDRMAVKDD